MTLEILDRMVDIEGAKKAFTKFYAKLVETLPINDLIANLCSDDEKTEVNSQGTLKGKMKYILDKVISPRLSIGDAGRFNKMIVIMESSDDPSVEDLAKQIQRCALDSSSSPSEDGVSVCISIFVYACVHVPVCICCNNLYGVCG